MSNIKMFSNKIIYLSNSFIKKNVISRLIVPAICFTKVLSTYSHLFVLVPDGGYIEPEDETLCFREMTPSKLLTVF